MKSFACDLNANIASETAWIYICEAANQLIRFPGQYYDKETGLHYNYFRYYKPEIGRYLTPDPIGLLGGINPFIYVANNPINRIDPSGLHWVPGPRGPIPHRHRPGGGIEIVNPNDSGAWPGDPAHYDPDYYPRPFPGYLKDLVIDTVIATAEKVSESRGCKTATKFFKIFGYFSDLFFPSSTSKDENER